MSWKYIFDELPKPCVEVLWCNPHSGIMQLGSVSPTWSGNRDDFTNEYFQYWMELPALPSLPIDLPRNNGE